MDITEQNFEWYVRNGTFGSINAGQDILVPAGVQIYTAAQNGPVYTLSAAITCPAGATSQYFQRHQFALRLGGQCGFRHFLCEQFHRVHGECLRLTSGDQ